MSIVKYASDMGNKKCIVITVRKTFMKGHPKAGLPTNFPEKIYNGILNPGFYEDNHPFLEMKYHTVRAGSYWKKVVEKVNAGTHYLSVRTWDGRPYVDKGQTEVCALEKLGWQDIEFTKGYVYIDNKFYCSNINEYDKIFNLAVNDGLSVDDFKSWFGHKPLCFYKPFKGGIIHFSDLIY